jgi:hypothetical protein
MGGGLSRPQEVRMLQMPAVAVRPKYEDKVKRIAHVNRWVQYSTHLDSFCSFYYDPAKKHLWVVQKIGDEDVLITKPSDEHLMMVTKKYGADVINVDFKAQPGMFYGF